MNHDENVLKVLRSARDMISDERHWTKHTSSRNSFGRPGEWYDEDGCQWCASAAIRRAYHQHSSSGDGGIRDFEVYEHAIIAVQGSSGYPQLALHEFNDKKFVTHKDVIEAFTKAIDNLTEKEGQK